VKKTTGSFTKKLNRKIEQKRIDSVSSRAIRSFSHIIPWIVLPTSRLSFCSAINIVHSVIANFVNIQQLQKKHITNIPVIYVDTKLDDKIPFTPEKVKKYLDFVPYFITPCSMLIKRFGLKKARLLCADYLDFIANLYKSAGSIYKYCLTTTHRPEYLEMKEFRFIHKNDPHYLCVPSLHISIITGCYTYFRDLFEREHFTQLEKDRWNKELYRNALAIGESVLYVKQHSVNCIPAALYMMTALYSSQFTTYDAVDFINNLFIYDKRLSLQDRAEIANHINFMYERLLLEGAYCDDWQEPIKHWLRTYAALTGQSFKR
jgi:hypothetical protein